MNKRILVLFLLVAVIGAMFVSAAVAAPRADKDHCDFPGNHEPCDSGGDDGKNHDNGKNHDSGGSDSGGDSGGGDSGDSGGCLLCISIGL